MSAEQLLYQLSTHVKGHAKEVSKYKILLKTKYEKIASNLKEKKKQLKDLCESPLVSATTENFALKTEVQSLKLKRKLTAEENAKNEKKIVELRDKISNLDLEQRDK